MSRAHTLISKLTSPQALRPYASIAEQILMSASNMLMSLLVVAVAGVEQFGIYSFLFVLTLLANGLFGTTLHRQMMLHIAAEADDAQRQMFRSTLSLEFAMMIGLTLLVAGLASAWSLMVSDQLLHPEHGIAILACLGYVAAYNLFDLFRQYLYTIDQQVYSLRCTLVFFTGLLLAMLAIHALEQPAHTVALAYAAMGLCHLAAILSNGVCRSALRATSAPGWKAAAGVFRRYFQQGRFSLSGMLVTWLQNQLMNPFLMLISGPLAVGYFSLARLIVMPMAVVNQGLVNSTTPGLRRCLKAQGASALTRRITRLGLINIALSAAYVSLILLAHLTGLLHRFVPDYATVQYYLLFWVVLLTVIMVRFWIGQFFVVSMRFKFMLKTGLIALGFSMTGMVFSGFVLDSIRLALCFVILGEFITIALFLKERHRHPPEAVTDVATP